MVTERQHAAEGWCLMSDREIVESVAVDHLTADIDRVAIEQQPGGGGHALPGREHSGDLPFDEVFDVVADEVNLTDYPDVCSYVRQNVERVDGPISFAPSRRDHRFD